MIAEGVDVINERNEIPTQGGLPKDQATGFVPIEHVATARFRAPVPRLRYLEEPSLSASNHRTVGLQCAAALRANWCWTENSIVATRPGHVQGAERDATDANFRVGSSIALAEMRRHLPH